MSELPYLAEASVDGINYFAVFIGVLLGFVSALVMIILYSRINTKKASRGAVEGHAHVGHSSSAKYESARAHEATDEDGRQSVSPEQIDLHVSTGSARDIRSRFATRHNSDLSQSSKSQRATIDISHEESDDANTTAEPLDKGAQSAKSYFRRIAVGRSASKYSRRSPPRKHAPAGLDTYQGIRTADSQAASSDDVHEFDSDDIKEVDVPSDGLDDGFFNYSPGGDNEGVDSSLHVSSNSVQSSSFGLHPRSGKSLLTTTNKSKSKSNVFQ